jgi:tetratricopeptide (TPR) repeat protein
MNSVSHSSSMPVANQDSAELAAQLYDLRPQNCLSQDKLDCAYAIGYNWLQLGDFEKSRSAFETLWGQCPDVAPYAAGLAHSALGQGQADVAVNYFLIAAGLDENNAGYMLGLGRAFQASKLPGHARLALDIAQGMAEQSQDHNTAEMARACLQLMEQPA